MRARSRGKLEHGIEHPGDTDTARRVSCCASLLFISTEPSRHALAFLLFFVNHMCGIGPLGQTKLLFTWREAITREEWIEVTLCNPGD